MKSNSDKAIELLAGGSYTCVLCKEGVQYTSTERGVKPLLSWLDAGIDLKGFSAADKVVGKAAAFLYVLLEVESVYAVVISEKAKEVLVQYGISVFYDTLVPGIRNRMNTGFCPMEDAVKEMDTPEEALLAIRNKWLQLQKN